MIYISHSSQDVNGKKYVFFHLPKKWDHANVRLFLSHERRRQAHICGSREACS